MLIFGSKKKCITKKAYFSTRNAAWQFLIENEVKSYPLDLQAIVKKHGWKVLDKENYILTHPELRKYTKKKEGLTFELDGKYIILIDADGNSTQRNRFTIAHEIGHIYLQHQSETNDAIEKEANMFASRILMPALLIKELAIKTPAELAELCNVSIEAATYRFTRYSEKLIERDKFYTSPLERQVYEQLKDFIKRRNNQ